VCVADLVAATALAMLVTATTLPVVAGALEWERATIGAQVLAAHLKRAQLEALRRGTSVAVRLAVESEDTRWQLFADGNGNGVTTREIGSGIDPPVAPQERLSNHVRGVSLRLNQTVPTVDGREYLSAGDDALRIGSTSLLSFAPEGTATSGTLYVAATRGPQLAVRVLGTTGRLRVLRFDPGARRWRY
jgi:Tfp pilus assembly protein FimT